MRTLAPQHPLLALAVALTLSGCASPPRSPLPGQSALTTLSGKLGVVVDGAPDRSFSAAFEMQGDDRSGHLTLTHPLGMKLGEAHWKVDGAELVTSEGVRRYDTAQALAQDLVGEPLPLQALPSWLQGRPWSGAPFAPLTPPSSGFRQFDWRVDTGQADEGRYVAVRETPPPAITVRVRLIAP